MWKKGWRKRRRRSRREGGGEEEEEAGGDSSRYILRYVYRRRCCHAEFSSLGNHYRNTNAPSSMLHARENQRRVPLSSTLSLTTNATQRTTAGNGARQRRAERNRKERQSVNGVYHGTTSGSGLMHHEPRVQEYEVRRTGTRVPANHEIEKERVVTRATLDQAPFTETHASPRPPSLALSFFICAPVSFPLLSSLPTFPYTHAARVSPSLSRLRLPRPPSISIVLSPSDISIRPIPITANVLEVTNTLSSVGCEHERGMHESVVEEVENMAGRGSGGTW